MLKKVKTTLQVTTALMLFACLVSGCKNANKDSSDVNITKYDVWSTYATEKIIQNENGIEYDFSVAKIDVSMMQNETEGTQLIIDAHKNINSYNLISTDLSDGNGNIIPKADISIYSQKYIKVAKKTDILNKDIIAGDMVPDMLLPMDTCIAFGENKVSAGNKQGITVEVTTHNDTVAGTYTGSFVLDIDGEKTLIPVTVKVWNFGLEGKDDFQSCFLIYYQAMLAGEYEASEDIVERYQEFLLKYKMGTFVIRSKDTTETLAREAVNFIDNENYNSICIPYRFEANYTANGTGADKIIEYVKEIIRLSAENGKPYYRYLYLYPSYFDEVDAYPTKYDDFVNVFTVGGEWDKTLQKIVETVYNMPEFSDLTQEMQADVLKCVADIPAVVPLTTYTKSWIENLHVTLCPQISLFDSDMYLQQYKAQAVEINNGELWTYTCVQPTFPYPTFHIDDYNLGTRVSGWMNKKFGVNGYLYWAVNVFEGINQDAWRDIDPYATAERASYCAGDGYLVYPGAYYGSEYPFASIRLQAYRDSIEDYDMLTIYETLVRDRAESYGIEVDFNSYVNDLYDSILYGAKYYTDNSLVFTAREELARRIQMLKGEGDLLVENVKKGVNVYSTLSELEIDGEKLNGVACGFGYKYAIENTTGTAKQISIKVGDNSYTYNVSAYKDLEMKNAKGNATSSASVENGILTASVVSEERVDEGATSRYKTYVQVETGSIKNASNIRFTINSENDQSLEAKVLLVFADGTTKTVGSLYVKEGRSRDVYINLSKSVVSNEELGQVKSIRLTFDNVDENFQLAETKEFTVSDMWIEIRG